jgi:hypothetical protein
MCECEWDTLLSPQKDTLDLCDLYHLDGAHQFFNFLGPLHLWFLLSVGVT